MTFEQFASCVREWSTRYPPEQVREYAASLRGQVYIDDLPDVVPLDAVMDAIAKGESAPGFLETFSQTLARRAELASERAPSTRHPAVRAKTNGHEWRGRPSIRAQALVREQLKHGPRSEATVMAAANFADIPERALLAAADTLGVRTRCGQWWLPR